MSRPRKDRTYRAVVRTFAVLFKLWGLRFDVRGAENIPASGPAVIAGNHIGFLDFTFLGYAARSRGRLIRFMSKRSVFDVLGVGRLMRAMGHIPVDRASGAGAYRQGRRLASQGELVGVFPEATISRSWLLKPFKRGAAAIAVTQSVPVVPTIVWGGHRILTVDGRRTLRRGTPVTIMIGRPLVPQRGETIEALNARLVAAMERLLDQAIDSYPGRPRHDKDRWWLPHNRGGTAPDPQTAARLDREALARIGESIEDG